MGFWFSAGVFAKFASSSWGKKLAKREAKRNQTDFGRYKAAVAKKEKAAKITKIFEDLKKAEGL